MTSNTMSSYKSTPSDAADGYEPTTPIPPPPPPLIAQGASVGHVPLGYLPQPGDVMYFTSAHHAIYDTFPGGDYVRAKKSPVDLTAPFTVEEALVSPIVDKKKGTPTNLFVGAKDLPRSKAERERERERGGVQRL